MTGTKPVFIDTTTFSSFAVVDRLDLLRRCVDGHAPHWTEAVRDEVEDGVSVGRAAHMQRVLDCHWLGSPWSPSTKRDQKSIYELQVGLNDGKRPPTAHLGEAECIHACEVTGGGLVTDDRGAFCFAERRGIRVRDTVRLLQEARATFEISADECWDAVEEMILADRTIGCGRPPVRADFA